MTANDHADVRFLLSGSRLMFMWPVPASARGDLGSSTNKKKIFRAGIGSATDFESKNTVCIDE